LPVPVAVLSKAWVCNRSLAGIVVSNPDGGIDDCLVWVLQVVRWRSLRRAYHSSRRVLSSVYASLGVLLQPNKGCCSIRKQFS